MESCYWCSDCSEMFEAGSHHLEHSYREVGGSDVVDTISALDEMINFGLARLETHEQEVTQAKEVKADIEDIRKNYQDNSKKRIERIVQDLRVAMEQSVANLLVEVNKKVGDMELKCQAIIATSRVKNESIKGFVQEAALTIPDEAGKLPSQQITKLLLYYSTVSNMERQSKARLSYVDLNIKYPDSYQRKKECQALADSVSGKLENPKRKSFLHDPLPGEEDKLAAEIAKEAQVFVKPLRRPKRRESRDALRN